jgi:hypothetical protein
MAKRDSKPVSTGTWNAADTDQFRRSSRKTVDEATKSKEAAKGFLVKLGTHAASGGLSDRYKG